MYGCFLLVFSVLFCIILMFFPYNVSYVFVVSPVSQYSLLSLYEPFCLNVHSVTLEGPFLKEKGRKKKQPKTNYAINMSAFVKAAPPPETLSFDSSEITCSCK